MKQFLIVVLAAIFIAGCKKSSGPKQPAAEYLEDGTWRVTELVVNGETKTALFNGYSFTFHSNGNVQASKAGITETGAWTVASAGSGQAAYPQLKIDFPPGGICIHLKQDWDLYGIMPTQISGHRNFSGSGEVYVLWLEKN